MNSFVDLPALLAACRALVGKVYLVGAGPGDPELLTLRAARLLAEADVVVYDHLVGAGVLGADRRAAPSASTSARNAATTAWRRTDINALLVRLAREGRQVVRLKGGDPFVFGRGGEELQALAADGVPFEVVPGITAACGVASYAGIPLTHRDFAQSCIFVTGHLKDGSCDLDWPALARPRQTVVIYMGLSRPGDDLRAADRAGLPPHWPAAVVANRARCRRSRWSAPRWPRWPTQVARRRPAVTLPDDRRRGGALRDELAWFEPREAAAPATGGLRRNGVAADRLATSLLERRRPRLPRAPRRRTPPLRRAS